MRLASPLERVHFGCTRAHALFDQRHLAKLGCGPHEFVNPRVLTFGRDQSRYETVMVPSATRSRSSALNCIAALRGVVVGHRSSIEKVPLVKFITAMLK